MTFFMQILKIILLVKLAFSLFSSKLNIDPYYATFYKEEFQICKNIQYDPFEILENCSGIAELFGKTNNLSTTYFINT